MKRQMSLLVPLLLSACISTVSTPTKTTSQEPVSTAPLIPTIHEASNEEEQPYCKVAPETVHSGSSVSVSIFNMPAEQYLAISFLTQAVKFEKTDANGNTQTSFMVPAGASAGLYPVSVQTDGATIMIECVPEIRVEVSPVPTLSNEQQLSMTAAQQMLTNGIDSLCDGSPPQGIHPSPNGQWSEVICKPDSIAITRADGAREWKLSSASLVNPYTDHFVNVVHWSNNGADAHVSVNPHTDGYWEPYHQGIVLYRIHLETGEISEILPLNKEDWIFYSFAFSPDDKLLSYIRTDQSPVVLTIRDQQTGAEQTFPFAPKYNTGGGFVWSPDGQKLVFSVTQFDETAAQYLATSIILWDRNISELTELVKDQRSEMRVIEWADDTKMILEAVIVESNEVKVTNYEFDLATNTLTQVAP